MRLTTPYQFKVPEVDDNGAIVASAIEDTIDQLNDHTHDGITSALLPLNSVETQSQVVSSASWAVVEDVPDSFRATVTMPVGLEFDKTPPQLFNNDTGEMLLLTCNKLGTSSFEIFTWDDELEVKVVYR